MTPVQLQKYMSDSSPIAKLDASQWLEDYGDALYGYALKRVGTSDVAEDLVQETFVAALRAAERFEGRSQVKTWLTSILRNKITDHLRKLGREKKHTEQDRLENEPTTFKNGHWVIGLKKWRSDPGKSIENQEFWCVIDNCIDKLPSNLDSAFRMRDLEQLAMSDICEALGITSTNLSVRLHRARVLLRDCIDRNWFSTGEQS